MPALKILEHVGKLARRGRLVERHDAIDDVIGAGLLVRAEILRLGHGFERPDDDARRIRSEIEGLPIKKGCLRQDDLWSSR